MSVTLTQFAYQAARDLGNLLPAQTLSPDMLNDVLIAANQWLDSMNLDRFFVYAMQLQTFTLNGGTQNYTIGPTVAPPNFVTLRPIHIEEASILLNNVQPVVRKPVTVINIKGRSDIPVDAIPFALPLKLYYDRGFDQANGFGNMFFWPGPLNNYLFEMFAWPGPTQQITQFADLVTAYNYPPGYARLIRKNLAVEIAPLIKRTLKNKLAPGEFDKNVAMVMQQAYEAKYLVESQNAVDPGLPCNQMFTGGRNKGAWNYAIGEPS